MDKIYSTDRPCIRGHLSPRYFSSRRCVACDNEDRRVPDVKKPMDLAVEAAADPSAVISEVARAFGLPVSSLRRALRRTGVPARPQAPARSDRHGTP